MITWNMLKKIIMTKGIENCYFKIPMKKRHKILGVSFTLGNEKSILTECKIKEKFNRMLNDNYKLEFISIYNSNLYGREEYYVNDLMTAINDNSIKVIIK